MKAIIVAMMIFYVLVGTISVAGNFAVLFVVYKSKQLRHSQYVYKCFIAISDIVCGFSISAYFMFYVLWSWNVNQVILLIEPNSTKLEVNKEKNNVTTNMYEIQEAALSVDVYSEIYNRSSLILHEIV